MNRTHALALALIITAIAFLAVFFLKPRPAFAECTGRAQCFSEQVTRVIDGDTIAAGETRIRLVLVDTPEKNEKGYEEATEFTKSLCLNKNAIIDQDDLQYYDDYGRMLAVVYCNGTNVNDAILEGKYGVLYKIFCDESEFGSADWAKKAGC
ncbi:MAG: thermonuclease family protein [Candidatus Aenigmarchaeota archaeon]|nr:thermonuclease family protein [Candidatus Aenigmarchaeota archaeon]